MMKKNIYTKSLNLILAVVIGVFGLTFFSSFKAIAQTAETELTEKQKTEQKLIDNNILFYNPDGARVCGGSSAAGTAPISRYTNEAESTANLERILNYFVDRGLSLAQASAIAGNIKQESYWNPTRIEVISTNTYGPYAREDYVPVVGVGFGLIQWTDDERQPNLVEYANETNRAYIDMDMQLDFIWKELTSKTINSLPAKLNSTLKPMQEVRSQEAGAGSVAMMEIVEKYARIFHDNYEISADPKKFETLKSSRIDEYYSRGIITDAEINDVRSGSLSYVYTRRVIASREIYQNYLGKIKDGDGSKLADIDNLNFTTTTGSWQGTNCPPKSFGNATAFQQKVIDYAWPLHCKGTTSRTEGSLSCNAMVPTPGYAQAIKNNSSNGGYSGDWRNPGQDCNGFVTTIVRDSGIDNSYNPERGGVSITHNWIRTSSSGWQEIYKPGQADAGGLIPGDVAIKFDSSHTFIWIGDVPNFQYKAASASYDESPNVSAKFGRFPMAGIEATAISKYYWYRKK